VLTDEIYNEVVFGDEATTSLACIDARLKDRVFVVNGVSKTYAMTGWRIGYGVGDAGLISAINKLQSQMSSCPCSISQAATVEALNGDQSFVKQAAAVYRARRDVAIDYLNRIPELQCALPEGAFYLFPSCAGVLGKTAPDGRRIGTDLDFVLYLLDSVGVAVLQGGAYGMPGYFRMSIATSEAVIKEGCRRIEQAVRALR
jgi:aspartate aminotransferase